jgi:precorrin-3B synthase
MTAHASTIPERRGVCPGLSAPMPTGDGLLVRFTPIGTIALAAFKHFCAAARVHGNGIVEVSARGSIQVRGLSAVSARQFAAEIAALKIAVEETVPILCHPLAGIDAEEIFDVTMLAMALRRALAERSQANTFAAKVSVVIDGGATLNLARVRADIRLTAQASNGDTVLRVAVGGDEADAVELGVVAPEHGVEAARRLLNVLAERGNHVRARDVIAAEGTAAFREALSSCPALRRPSALADRSCAKKGHGPHGLCHAGQIIALHRLRDGSLACGVGLAFGHADAAALERLADAAATAGASGLRAAPDRALLAIGLSKQSAAGFIAAAEQLGFITRADDPRRHVLACAGAPMCASAYIAARAMAPRIAAAVAPHLDGEVTIHISGCAKGCAYPAAAALTVIGTPGDCALVANGSARDAPFAATPVNELPAAIERYLREREAAHVRANIRANVRTNV